MMSIDKIGGLEELIDIIKRVKEGKTVICYELGPGVILFYKFENKRDENEISELRLSNKKISRYKKEEIKSFFGTYYPDYLKIVRELGI